MDRELYAIQYMGEWSVVEVCCYCERPLQASHDVVSRDNRLAWKPLTPHGRGYEHIKHSLPCNQDHDLKKAERLKLVRVPHQLAWEKVCARAKQIMPKFEFVCVVNPTKNEDHHMNNETHRLYVPENAALLISQHKGAPDLRNIDEIAQRILAVYGEDAIAEAVQELYAASVLKSLLDEDAPINFGTQSMQSPARKR